MRSIASTATCVRPKARPALGRLFFLNLSVGHVLSVASDGSDSRIVVAEARKLPDGIALDTQTSHIYWTNMGNPKRNDGSIMRCGFDGENVAVVIPPGGTFTPKQLQLDRSANKLYWSDREGMRVMRASLDGSDIETLVDTSNGDLRPGPDETKWCVGVAVDGSGGKFYWTQKGTSNGGVGRIFRAGIALPEGQSPTDRTDVELLFSSLPEPIDLDIDPIDRMLYWTDRGDPPRGNTVNRAPLDSRGEAGATPEILVSHLMEGIGLTLDVVGRRMFFTDFGGSVYCADLDGSGSRTLLANQGNLTGIAYAEAPSGAASV